MWISAVVIVLVGVFFLAMGLYGLVAPSALPRPFGIRIEGPAAKSEIRAVYGGFGIAIAMLLGAAAFDVGGIRTGAVVAVGVALAGMAFGRVISRLADGKTTFYPNWFYFVVEAVASALLFVSV